jgi:hypothetical protein
LRLAGLYHVGGFLIRGHQQDDVGHMKHPETHIFSVFGILLQI